MMVIREIMMILKIMVTTIKTIILRKLLLFNRISNIIVTVSIAVIVNNVILLSLLLLFYQISLMVL